MRVLLGLFIVLLPVGTVLGQTPPPKGGIPVIVVATASEYVPRSTTISRPGHAYTDCIGSSEYFGRFDSDGSSGRISLDGTTRTACSTTYTPPREDTLTTYKRVNYTVVRGGDSLYLLSCTQTWKITKTSRALLGLMGAANAGAGNSDPSNVDRAAANARGRWTDCPGFGIGAQYSLAMRSTSDAQLSDSYGTKPAKLDYLSSVSLPPRAPAPISVHPGSPTSLAKVRVTSTPDGGEIYVDGKFYGNAPSEISLMPGEHAFRIAFQGREWVRSVQITSGEINVHAE
jgi:hypothetical protein